MVVTAVPPRMRRRAIGRRVAMVAVALGALVVATTDVYVLTQWNRATPVAFHDVVGRFRADVRSDPPTSAAPTATTALVSQAGPPVSSVAARAASPRSIDTPAQPGPYTSPLEGVYRYRTHGKETTSIAGASHTYPDETYWTVRHQDGCRWEVEKDFLKEHTEWSRYCSQAGELIFFGEKRTVSFFGVSDSDELSCDPPALLQRTDEPAGTTYTAVCHDPNSGDTAHVKATYLGRAPVTIGGQAVDAVHVKLSADIEGRANGSTVEEDWFSPQTGQQLHCIRTLDATVDATFGVNIHYHEDAEFLLESLTPTT